MNSMAARPILLATKRRWGSRFALGGNVFYLDPVSGDRRLKRRYVWAFAGFALGLLVGKLLL